MAAIAAMLAALWLAPAASGAEDASGDAYAVGLRSYTFVDESRATPPNRGYPGAPERTLPTMLLYPARGEAGTPVAPGAKPIRERSKDNRFPLIVFSHGLGASGPAYRFLLEQFAAAGYVVAAPDFPLSKARAPGGVTPADYRNQPGDVSFVISEMRQLARQPKGLRRTIDRRRIAVVGHSLGGMTTLGVATNSCCIDPRIDAASAWSGFQLPFPGSFYATPTPPLLLVHGEDDGTVFYNASANAFRTAPAPRALLTLIDGPHVPFVAPWREPLVDVTLDFLDGYLEDDRGALRRIEADGSVPGAATIQLDLGD